MEVLLHRRGGMGEEVSKHTSSLGAEEGRRSASTNLIKVGSTHLHKDRGDA